MTNWGYDGCIYSWVYRPIHQRRVSCCGKRFNVVRPSTIQTSMDWLKINPPNRELLFSLSNVRGRFWDFFPYNQFKEWTIWVVSYIIISTMKTTPIWQPPNLLSSIHCDHRSQYILTYTNPSFSVPPWSSCFTPCFPQVLMVGPNGPNVAPYAPGSPWPMSYWPCAARWRSASSAPLLDIGPSAAGGSGTSNTGVPNTVVRVEQSCIM